MNKHFLNDNQYFCIERNDSPTKPVLFFSSDSEEKYKKSLEYMPQDWYYRNNSIKYFFNEVGYRSRKVSDVKDNNFFVTFGCSHTEGIGLHMNDRYGDIVSNSLNIPYLNFGRGGASVYFIYMANVLFHNKFIHKPKFVICQWPEPERYSLWFNQHSGPLCIVPESVNTVSENIQALYKQRLLNPTLVYTENYFHIQGIKLLCKKSNIKFIDFSLVNLDQHNTFYKNFVSKHFENRNKDLTKTARDLIHPGIETNKIIAEYILDKC
jgi:hypothetical protein